MLQVLKERAFPVTELIPIATERSAGRQIEFNGKQWTVVTPQVGL
ncbi:MAG: aspartate-semialdehyde dehydrogenase, partial [Mucinivorans sp.]